VAVAPTSARPVRERRLLVAGLAFLLGALSVALLYRSDVLDRTSTPGVQGSGVPATQARHLPAFTAVELAGDNNVVVRAGVRRSVLVRADDNLLEHVTTRVRSGTLVVANTPGSFTTKRPMVVEIGVPALEALTLSGNGNIVVQGIDAKRLVVSLPGSGTLTGSGTAARLTVTVSGSGSVQFTRLVARDVRAAVSGSGAVFVTATDRLAASVSGSGAILYGGSPHDVTKNVTGTGAVTGG
jgi:hypothetical protein